LKLPPVAIKIIDQEDPIAFLKAIERNFQGRRPIFKV
jgi:hypothetical protein